MPYHETDSTWMVCLNCEAEFGIEEVFVLNEDDETLTECPICGSHSLRKCDSYGFDLGKEYHDFDSFFDEW